MWGLFGKSKSKKGNAVPDFSLPGYKPKKPLFPRERQKKGTRNPEKYTFREKNNIPEPPVAPVETQKPSGTEKSEPVLPKENLKTQQASGPKGTAPKAPQKPQPSGRTQDRQDFARLFEWLQSKHEKHFTGGLVAHTERKAVLYTFKVEADQVDHFVELQSQIQQELSQAGWSGLRHFLMHLDGDFLLLSQIMGPYTYYFVFRYPDLNLGYLLNITLPEFQRLHHETIQS